ncbi:hypothetical protein ABII15_05710 [Streptomyces sp. HUAS MG91]|uniref:Protein phosphatase n=1 Tax=Streptomyces tabacisoli TaxID=3156398 RepID=A0AAU8ILW4_9ACTN
MSEQLIDPAGIPHFIGDLATLDTDVTSLTVHAGEFRTAGSDVHTEFQGLSAFYQAPEADELFASTLPVKTKTDAFADDLEKVASALSAYSTEVQPLVQKLETLKADATAFVNSVSGDDDWRKDQDKVDHNNDLWHDVNHTVAAFQSAERASYNKIMALIDGTRLTTDDGSHGEGMYGFKADDLDHAEETPWGSSAEREYEGIEWLYHRAKSFVWDGFIVDGVWGTIKGLGTLVGFDGWDMAGEAWKHLGQLAIASSITMMPGVGVAYWTAPEDKLPSWLRESRTTMKETGKALVAWDTWKTNPSRAAGQVTFNGLTAIFTGGSGSAASGAGKAGAVARALSVTGKVARIVDPMTYVGKAGKFALVKVGDTFTALKNLKSGVSLDLLKQADAIKSPRIPETAIPYVDNATGKVVYLTDEGHLLNSDGSLHQHAEQAPGEVSAADRTRLDSSQQPSVGTGTREPQLVGAHAATNSAGDAGQTSGHVAGSTARNLDQGSTAAHSAAGSGSSHGSAHGPTPDHSVPAGTRPGPGAPDGGAPHAAAPDGQNADHHANGAQGSNGGDLTPAERQAIQDEHVRKANEEPDWFKENYNKEGHRLPPKDRLVDGAELPILAKKPGGGWVAKHDMPSGPSEIKLGTKPLPRSTAPHDVLPTLDKTTANRQAYKHLINAQKAFDEVPSAANHTSLTTAQDAYAKQLGDVPPNSKISEKLGEEASRLHVIPHEFPGAKEIVLPKTPNGAHVFDGAYRIDDDGILIAEDKAPKNDLDWRQGRADPEDPANPHDGDDGGAAGMRVKQGTRLYLRTILAEMTRRGGRDAELAREFREALKAGKLRYVLVKAQEPNGSAYAGAVFEEMKIY